MYPVGGVTCDNHHTGADFLNRGVTPVTGSVSGDRPGREFAGPATFERRSSDVQPAAGGIVSPAGRASHSPPSTTKMEPVIQSPAGETR